MRRLLLLLCCLSLPVHAEITARDDAGNVVRLAQPARRIVSLAPHVTENLYAAGAGDRLAGAVSYSDYPEAARKLPNVGSYDRPDLEAIVALRPDLVVAWQSGNPPAVLARLKALRIPVFQTEPGRLADIPASIEQLGRLTGTQDAALKAAESFRGRLADLRRHYSGKPVVPVFYQAWHKPLWTVGGGQVISDVIRVCGGENVFGQLPAKAPAVSVEAVLTADPEAIIASGMGGHSAEPSQGMPAPPRGAANAVSVGAKQNTPVGLEIWREWPRQRAVARNNLFTVHPDLLQRPTPRILEGAAKLCLHLETARERRPR